jgi:hypothetical protein
MYYNPNWFIPSILLLSTLVPFLLILNNVLNIEGNEYLLTLNIVIISCGSEMISRYIISEIEAVSFQLCVHVCPLS